MMRLTRRNVLIVLGVLTIAGGALFGAGAFSQVSADRTVTASTADDSAANLQLEANATTNPSVVSTNNGELEISASNLNGNATSTWDYAINVTPSAGDGASYDIYVQSASGLGDGSELNINQTTSGTIVGSGNAVTVSDGNQVDLSVHFDLTGESNRVDNVPSEITFVAEEA